MDERHNFHLRTMGIPCGMTDITEPILVGYKWIDLRSKSSPKDYRHRKISPTTSYQENHQYPPVFSSSNGKSPINGGFNGKIS